MRDRNTPFALVTKPVAALRQLLGAVEGKLRVQVMAADFLDGGWGRTERLIRVLEVVQAQLLGALFWNWKVRKKREMLADASERFQLRQRFGGLDGLEAWEARAQSPHSVIPAPEPGSREGECEGAEIGGRDPRVRGDDGIDGDYGKGKVRERERELLFRLARVRSSLNNRGKSPHERSEDAGSPSGSRGVEKHEGGPASERGNLRRDYQIEVWPVELMWRRERRARRSSAKACGRVMERLQRRERPLWQRAESYRERFEPRARGSPFRAAA